MLTSVLNPTSFTSKHKSQSWISSRIAPLDSTTWHKMYLFIYHMTCRMKSKRSRQTDCKCKVFCFSEKWHNTPKFNNNDPISSHFTMQWNPRENCISWFYFCYHNYHQYWLLNLAALISRGYKKSHVFEKYSMRYEKLSQLFDIARYLPL